VLVSHHPQASINAQEQRNSQEKAVYFVDISSPQLLMDGYLVLLVLRNFRGYLIQYHFRIQFKTKISITLYLKHQLK